MGPIVTPRAAPSWARDQASAPGDAIASCAATERAAGAASNATPVIAGTATAPRSRRAFEQRVGDRREIGNDGIGTGGREVRGRGGMGDGDAAQTSSLRGKHAAGGVFDGHRLLPCVGAAELLKLREAQQEGPGVWLRGGGPVGADDHLDQV